MSTENVVSRWNWLWAILITLGVGGITGAAVTQTQVSELRESVTQLESFRIENTEGIAEIKTTQKQQSEDIREIKQDIKVLLREVRSNDDTKNRR